MALEAIPLPVKKQCIGKAACVLTCHTSAMQLGLLPQRHLLLHRHPMLPPSFPGPVAADTVGWIPTAVFRPEALQKITASRSSHVQS